MTCLEDHSLPLGDGAVQAALHPFLLQVQLACVLAQVVHLWQAEGLS